MGAKHFGARVALEDPALLTGRGRFVDDVMAPRHAARLLRPQPARARRIRSIDAAAARAMPGVHAVLTADDLPPHMATSQIDAGAQSVDQDAAHAAGWRVTRSAMSARPSRW